MNFDQAFEKVIGHEGGYVADSRDSGGETNWGISKRAYPNLDIKNLTLYQAKAIYSTDYWAKSGCDRLPEFVRFHMFDFAVNSGVTAAVKASQRVAKTVPDGVIGPKTIQAISAMDQWQFIAQISAQRLALMVGADGWKSFSRGWTLRLVDNLMLEE